MSNYCCNACCSNSTLKKNNVEKYPWLKDVEFRSFPHVTREIKVPSGTVVVTHLFVKKY